MFRLVLAILILLPNMGMPVVRTSGPMTGVRNSNRDLVYPFSLRQRQQLRQGVVLAAKRSTPLRAAAAAAPPGVAVSEKPLAYIVSRTDLPHLVTRLQL